MYYHYYVIMHVRDLYRSVIRIGHCVPISHFCVLCERDVDILMRQTSITQCLFEDILFHLIYGLLKLNTSFLYNLIPEGQKPAAGT